MVCLEMQSGEIKWTSTESLGKYCSMVTNGDKILALSSNGKLRLMAAERPEDDDDLLSYLCSHVYPDVICWSSDPAAIPLTFPALAYDNDSFVAVPRGQQPDSGPLPSLPAHGGKAPPPPPPLNVVRGSADEAAVQRAAQLLAGADRLLVLAGAGMGCDGGLPDYRSSGGFWSTM